MIDATASLRAAETISVPALVGYLHSNGWSVGPSRVTGVSIFSKNVTGIREPIRFILPMGPGSPDEQRRIADALRTLAAMERRSEEDIANDVQRQFRRPELTVFASVNLSSQSAADMRAFEEVVRDEQLVRECWMLSGEVDFILKCVVPDMTTFQELISRLTEAPHVRNVRTSLVLHSSKDNGGVNRDEHAGMTAVADSPLT